MDKKLIDSYKAKLEKEMALLLSEIKDNEKPVDFGRDPEDMDEGTDRAEEIGNRLSVAEDLRNRLDEVTDALDKIRRGTYGICEKCGKEIGTDILDVDPESRVCRKCKAKD